MSQIQKCSKFFSRPLHPSLLFILLSSPDLIKAVAIQWGLTVNCQTNVTKWVIYNNVPCHIHHLLFSHSLISLVVPSVSNFPTNRIHPNHSLSSLTVWSCSACQRSTSQTSSTCATSPWGRCTCSLSPSSRASCCSGWSRRHLPLSYSPWWWVDHHQRPLSLH